MSIAAIGKVIERALRSKYLYATKQVGNDLVMLFHNPKSGNCVVKSVNKELGQISTYGYKGNRRVLSLNGEKISLVDDIGTQTLRDNPQALALIHLPDKAIVESVHPLLHYKSVAAGGQVTNYDNFFGNWIKGKIESQSMARFVDKNPFIG